MNIKISKEQADKLFNVKQVEYVIGSHLYGTNTKKSDTDILVIYDLEYKSSLFLPNFHQFQWDDKENNKQYIFTTRPQFYKNLLSGDSTINFDVFLTYFENENKLEILRTYKIIKSFIGFAKRDIKQYSLGKDKNKLFHINRGLYCAEELLNNRLPNINKFKELNDFNLENKEILLSILKLKESHLRDLCNSLFDSGELTMYPVNVFTDFTNEFEQLLINANNIKEFKYD